MSSKKDYSKLDAAILAQIAGGNCKAMGLNAALDDLAREADRDSEEFRVIDRRLQALRKKGKIEFDTKKGWSMKGGA